MCTHVLLTSSLVETAMPPVVGSPVLVGNAVLMQWNHTNKGPCYSDLTFSYNITWYPVGGGTGQMDTVETATACSNSEDVNTIQYIITNLLPSTRYQLKIVGFTSTRPQVHSEPVTVGLATQGKTCYCM